MITTRRIVDPSVCVSRALSVSVFDGEYLEGIFQDKTRGYYARSCQGTKMATSPAQARPANTISKQALLSPPGL